MKSCIHIGIIGMLAACVLAVGCGHPSPGEGDAGPGDAGVDGGSGTAPETTLTAAPSGTVSSSAAHFTFTSSQPESTFECSLDSAAFAACASPKDYANLADGAHSFLVRALAGGLADETPARAGWSIDSTAPDTALASGPEDAVASGSARFTFTSPLAGATFECSLDSAAFAACASPQDFTGLADGAHTFRVRALNALGSADATPASRAWRVDTTPPETQLVSSPPALAGRSTADFTFSANEPATFECSLDGAAFASCASPTSYGALADGRHTFQARALDAVLNADATPAAFAWTVDTAPPDTAISSGPSGLASSATASFTFSATEPGNSFECALDSAGFTPCASPLTLSNLADGAHALHVRAVDAAGNTDASPATRAWSIDSTAPDTTLSSGPSGTTGSRAATFAFASNEAGATFECNLDGAGFGACASPVGYSGLADGAHAFAVRAVDAAGNVDTTPATRAWTVDVTPPDTTLASGPSGTVASASASFAFTATEPGATFECSLDAAAFAPCTSPRGLTNLADGAHTFAVRARDAALNVDPTPASRTWKVDTTPPDTTLGAKPPALTRSPSASFTFTASEPGATFQCSLDAATFTPCASPASYASLAEGAHTFAVRALDSVGNADATPATHGWTIDSTPPDTAITSGPAGATSATAASFDFSATEPGATFECSLDGAAFSACAPPKGYASLAEGAHAFAVRAVDAAGNVDLSPASRTWTVDTTPPDTAITSGPSGTVASATATLAFSATEPSATFQCSLDGAAFSACASPASLTGLAEGGHTFAVRAVDAAGNLDATPALRAWSVDVTAPDTALTSGPSGLVASASATFSFTSPEPGATFQCSLDAAAFAACASPRSYTGLSDGAHTFAVRALDAVGNADPTPATAGWTVDTTPPDTTLSTSTPPFTSAGAASFSFTATEPGSTFECSFDAATFAACVSPADFSGLADGSHSFRVRALDALGNTDATPASFSWTVDTQPPDTTITSGPSGPVTGTSPTLTFTSSEPGGTFECALDTVTFTACSSPTSLNNLALGAHTFTVRAIDRAGNTESDAGQHHVDHHRTGLHHPAPGGRQHQQRQQPVL